jgi:hypothetical protein
LLRNQIQEKLDQKPEELSLDKVFPEEGRRQENVIREQNLGLDLELQRDEKINKANSTMRLALKEG